MALDCMFRGAHWAVYLVLTETILVIVARRMVLSESVGNGELHLTGPMDSETAVTGVCIGSLNRRSCRDAEQKENYRPVVCFIKLTV